MSLSSTLRAAQSQGVQLGMSHMPIVEYARLIIFCKTVLAAFVNYASSVINEDPSIFVKSTTFDLFRA